MSCDVVVLHRVTVRLALGDADPLRRGYEAKGARRLRVQAVPASEIHSSQDESCRASSLKARQLRAAILLETLCGERALGVMASRNRYVLSLAFATLMFVFPCEGQSDGHYSSAHDLASDGEQFDLLFVVFLDNVSLKKNEP